MATGPVRFGDPTGKPSMEALPSLDVVEQELTDQMRTAERLSAESLDFPEPVPPSSRDSAVLEVWGSQTFGPWLAQKHRRAEQAKQELDRAAVENQRQRVMAGALVGLVFEDVARVLLAVPAPSELDSEPEVLTMYREVMSKEAEPYLRHAKLAYDACAANAKAIATMLHWSQFCGARSQLLPAWQEEPKDDGQGETSVSVVPE